LALVLCPARGTITGPACGGVAQGLAAREARKEQGEVGREPGTHSARARARAGPCLTTDGHGGLAKQRRIVPNARGRYHRSGRSGGR